MDLKNELVNMATTLDEAMVFASTQAMSSKATKKAIDKKIDALESKHTPQPKGLFKLIRRCKDKR